jgi:hypothetical protein
VATVGHGLPVAMASPCGHDGWPRVSNHCRSWFESASIRVIRGQTERHRVGGLKGGDGPPGRPGFCGRGGTCPPSCRHSLGAAEGPAKAEARRSVVLPDFYPRMNANKREYQSSINRGSRRCPRIQTNADDRANLGAVTAPSPAVSMSNPLAQSGWQEIDQPP